MTSVLVRDPVTKRYSIGPAIHEWSYAALQTGTPINVARKEVIKFCMETGRQVRFLVLLDLDILIVERCEMIDDVPVNRPMPTRRIWYETGTGKTIVAFASPEIRASILERTYKLKNVTPPPLPDLEAELSEIRTRGYAIAENVWPAGQIGIVAPILDSSGYAVAAVGTVMEADELEQPAGRNLITQLQATAVRVAHYLGMDDPTALGLS